MLDQELLHAFNPWWSDGAARPPGLKPVRRRMHARLLAHIQGSTRRAALLLGPRQVGKTTLLLQLADDLLEAGLPPANLLYFDLSDERVRKVSPRDVAAARPATAVSAEFPLYLFLDEITRFEGWDQWLKQAVDHGAGERIVVTDSAASVLRRGGRESGQGRWDEYPLEGLTFSEFIQLRTGKRDSKAEFQKDPGRLLGLFLELGGLPEHAWVDAGFSEVHQRIRIDIADRAVYRDLSRFNVDVHSAIALFAYLAANSGGIFDPAARARDLAVDPRTIRGWLDLGIDTGLFRLLPRKAARPAARLRSHSKIFAFDHSLVSAFSPSARPFEDSATVGKVHETVIFRQLRETLEPQSIAFFRSRDKLEIDFVVERPKESVAIEVTSARRLRQEKLEGLRAACEQAGIQRALLVHTGYQAERRGMIEIVPLPSFLLEPERFLGTES